MDDKLMHGCMKIKVRGFSRFFHFLGNFFAKRPIKGVKRKKEDPMSIIDQRVEFTNSEWFISTTEISEDEREHYDLYMQAHRMMPYYYFYDPVFCGGEVRRSVAVIDAAKSDLEQLMRALAILGHSPCLEAVKALRAYGESQRPLAGVARLALDECSTMFARIAIDDLAS